MTTLQLFGINWHLPAKLLSNLAQSCKALQAFALGPGKGLLLQLDKQFPPRLCLTLWRHKQGNDQGNDMAHHSADRVRRRECSRVGARPPGSQSTPKLHCSSSLPNAGSTSFLSEWEA